MEISRGGVMVTAYFHLLLRFRMSGTIRLLHLLDRTNFTFEIYMYIYIYMCVCVCVCSRCLLHGTFMKIVYIIAVSIL